MLHFGFAHFETCKFDRSNMSNKTDDKTPVKSTGNVDLVAHWDIKLPDGTHKVEFVRSLFSFINVYLILYEQSID